MTTANDGIPICGRLLVGLGDDTYDPVCIRRPGHTGRCLADGTGTIRVDAAPEPTEPPKP